MTDFYPQEEGAIFDADSYIIPCYPDGAVTELASVKFGTTVAGRISIAQSTALGDGFGIALKEATGAGAPSRLPILVRGIVKVTQSGLATKWCAVAGSYMINSIITTYTCLGGAQDWLDLKVGGGASYIAGMCLQTGTAAGDEVLLLFGKTM
jgi:hypothetical protein